MRKSAPASSSARALSSGICTTCSASWESVRAGSWLTSWAALHRSWARRDVRRQGKRLAVSTARSRSQGSWPRDRAEQCTEKCEQQVAQENAESDHDDAERGQDVGAGERRCEKRAQREPEHQCSEHAPCDAVLEQPAASGRENRSNQRLRRSNAVSSFCREGGPSSSLRQRAGSQMHRRPTTSCSATSIVTGSRTCVAPPVGSGSVGSAMSSTKMSAKLRGPNSSMRLPRVFG